MRVAHICAHVGGGVGSVLGAFVESLPAFLTPTCKHNIFCLDSCVDLPKELKRPGLLYDSMAKHLIKLRRSLLEYDVVLCHYWNNPLLAAYLGDNSLPPLPTVFWIHNSGLAEPHIIPNYILNSSASIVFTTQASLGAPNVRSCPSKADSFQTIPSLRSLRDFFDLSKHRPNIGAKRRLLYLGTVSSTKMHPDSAFIFAELSRVGFEIVVVGGPDQDGLSSEVAALGGTVITHGQQKDVRAFYKEAEIFIYPLRQDHYGTGEQVIHEAMASGLPVVAFDNPPERLIVKHAETGLLAKSATEMVAQVRSIATNFTLYEAMSRAAIARAKSGTDPSVMTSMLLDALSNQISRPAAALGRQWQRFSADKGLSAFACHSFFGGLSRFSRTDDSHEWVSEIFESIRPDLDLRSNRGVWINSTKGSPFHYRTFFPFSPGLNTLCKLIQNHG